MQTLKRRFFALRNGVLADALRKSGSAFAIIFGLNLPQLVEIATETGQDADLARRLWQNRSTRESMLMAPMLMPVDAFSQDEACSWIEQVPDVETADILCHRLLRKLPYAPDLVEKYMKSDDRMQAYTALRLLRNIARLQPELAGKYGISV